jgi:hypothetical protein
MSQTPTTLLVFVDGLGLGPEEPDRNPVFSGCCPRLAGLLRAEAKPVDACMGVPGLPQSATGQASLLTGVNAPALVGRHVEGLPGPQLKQLVRDRNIFSALLQRGYHATFANAYYADRVEEIRSRRMQSVTTVASLAAFNGVRMTADMLAGRAVYQDLTRQFLRARGYAGPLVTPRESGEHLLRIAAAHDFTLFEYFQTDRVAHKGTLDDIRRVLGQLDEFLGVVLAHPGTPGRLLLLVSDHGNVEDHYTRQHTANPVPFVAVGEGAAFLRGRVRSLVDVCPALLDLYPDRSLSTPPKAGRRESEDEEQ